MQTYYCCFYIYLHFFSNPKSNVTYREFSFGLEPETRKCQPSSRNLQTGIINDKKVALCEIRNILYGMMNEESSKNPSNDYLISQLQKIMTTLKEIEILEINGSSILKDLVEEHSINGLCETVIKNKLMAITETFNDGIKLIINNTLFDVHKLN